MIVIIVRAVMVMLVLVLVAMVVMFVSVVRMCVRVPVTVALIMLFGRDMNLELHALDACFLAARDVQVITVQREHCQLTLKLASIDTQVDQRAEEHVAADAAEDVEVEGFHPIGNRPQGH